ncbi:SMC-Scp complex subunit ScpB [uncultured Thermanaerothrix sp.]|uniref:SMC-Scp complex subunit ScpB n=1 Tax=uncultured Thermanaerothrix sp. TaxID=1195149 RepID=UPI002605D01B|nr:SMC-Scp complex subunit ScpB [uncultured Thermanaerothrix sp.]
MQQDNLDALSLPLESIVEALIFVASSPLTPAQLATAIGVREEEIRAALLRLEESYQKRGLRLRIHQGHYELTTAPEVSLYVERLLGLEVGSRLSKAALETLAIIAYRQPITRAGIEAIRGVNSDSVVRSLLAKGLIEERGRADSPGRPLLYGTTSDFLAYFGLESLDQLPPLEASDEESSDNSLLKD